MENTKMTIEEVKEEIRGWSHDEHCGCKDATLDRAEELIEWVMKKLDIDDDNIAHSIVWECAID
jgi:hypothetical protein